MSSLGFNVFVFYEQFNHHERVELRFVAKWFSSLCIIPNAASRCILGIWYHYYGQYHSAMVLASSLLASSSAIFSIE